jgi:hypothetical protein
VAIGGLIVEILLAIAGASLAAVTAAAFVAWAGIAIAVVGLVVGIISIFVVLSPEVFPVQIGTIALPEADSNFDGELISPVFKLDFEAFGGHYRLQYTWELAKNG